MTITARDIARELRLSQPTVSRILSGDPNHRVAATTRERVLATAKRMGYQPNAVARSLRRGRTDIIGLYSNHDYDTRNDFHGTIVGALQRACEARRQDLLLHSALHGRPAEDMYGKLRDGRVDGLLLHARSDDPLVEIIGSSALPVVALADPLPTLPSVTVDDVDGIRQSVDYLARRGYRRFAYVCPEGSLSSVDRRRAAFADELAARGFAPEDRQVIRIDWENLGDAVERLLESGQQTAVCCWNDRTAYRLLTRCADLGVPVPDRIAVVGFDGFLSDKLPARRLVTVRCPWEKVATTAFDCLLRRIEEGKAVDGVPVEVRLPVTLIEGDTA